MRFKLSCLALIPLLHVTTPFPPACSPVPLTCPLVRRASSTSFGVCQLNSVSPVVVVNEQTWDLVGKGNSAEVGNAKHVNNSLSSCSPLRVPHCVHVKPTSSCNFKCEYGSNCCSTRQVINLLIQIKNGVINDDAENPSLFKARYGRHCTGENSLDWKRFYWTRDARWIWTVKRNAVVNSYAGQPQQSA